MVDPVTIAALGALSSGLAGFLARYAAKRRKAKRTRKAARKAETSTKRPSDLPRVNPVEFVQTWGFELKRMLAPEESEAPPPPPPPTRRHTASGRAIAILNGLEPVLILASFALVAWLLADGFLLWLEPEIHARVAPAALIGITIVGPAAVGYSTNWIAIKMLFHPRRRNRVWTGCIPDRRDQLADAISDAVLEQLVNPKIIQEYLHQTGAIRNIIHQVSLAAQGVLQNPTFRREMKALAWDAVEDFVTSEGTQAAVAGSIEEKVNQWTGTTLGGKVAQAFKTVWGPLVKQEILRALPDLPEALEGVFDHLDERIDAMPQLLEAQAGRIEAEISSWVFVALKRVDFRTMIKAQLEKMDEGQLERMLTGPVSQELRFVQTSGGIFGLLVGLAILFPWFRLACVAGIAALFLLYRLTVEAPKPVAAAAGTVPAATSA